MTWRLTVHAARRAAERGPAFGLDVEEVASRVARCVMAGNSHCVAILCLSEEIVYFPDGANGDVLCALVRGGVADTVVPRRLLNGAQRKRWEGLQYVYWKTLEVF